MQESERPDVTENATPAGEQDADQAEERSPGGDTPTASIASEETAPLDAVVRLPPAGHEAGQRYPKHRRHKRIMVASALTTATLCLLVIALLATSATATWSALGRRVCTK